MAHSKTATGWDKLVYYDEQNEPCIDLIVDGVKRQFLVRDVVCLFYHGPRPYPYSVSHVIDSLKPCTPDNVGWLSQRPDAHRNSASEGVKHLSSEAQKSGRPLKRAKRAMKWDHLFFVNDDGALYLGGTYEGEWKRFLLEEYLSESYPGPWPVQDSYAFIIDLSKGRALENLGWMTQDPDYRTVKYG
jgi:hypothetical protein